MPRTTETEAREDGPRHDSLRQNSARQDRQTRDMMRESVRLASEQAREATEAAQTAFEVAGPALAARISDARAMTRAMLETQSRLAIAWFDLAWTPIITMSRMWRAGQDGGTGHPGAR